MSGSAAIAGERDAIERDFAKRIAKVTGAATATEPDSPSEPSLHAVINDAAAPNRAERRHVTPFYLAQKTRLRTVNSMELESAAPAERLRKRSRGTSRGFPGLLPFAIFCWCPADAPFQDLSPIPDQLISIV